MQEKQICKKCGHSLHITEEFWYKKQEKDSFSFCKICKKCIKERNARYYEEHKEKIMEVQVKYREAHYEEKKQYMIEYHKTHKESISKRGRQWRLSNKDKANEKTKRYYNKHPDRISARRVLYHIKHKERIGKRMLAEANFNTYAPQLTGVEETRNVNGKLQVSCVYCGRFFFPTVRQVQSRIGALNGYMAGEHRLYCSTECKNGCPIYRRVKYPKEYKIASSREANPILRQIVFKRDNYTCQKCGTTESTLHCHHIIPARQNPMTANDPDICITYCKNCHKETHKQIGCTSHDLKCG